MTYEAMKRQRAELTQAGYFAELGRRIRATRMRRGVSVEDLAEQAGIAVSTITRLERGAGNARLSTLVTIAVVLNVAVRSLVPPMSFVALASDAAADDGGAASPGPTNRTTG